MNDTAIQRAEESANVLDFAQTLKELRKHLDPKQIKQREGWRDRNGNVQMVDYVEWHTVADILDDAAPNWQSVIKDIREIGDLIAVTVAITIDGVSREGIGTGTASNEMGIKKAEHDGLKRAAVKFGIARDLYRKESESIERHGAATNDDGFPSQPAASSPANLVTIRQLAVIKALSREIGIDPNGECQAVMGCNTDELSKKAASAMIQHLQEMQKPNSTPKANPQRLNTPSDDFAEKKRRCGQLFRELNRLGDDRVWNADTIDGFVQTMFEVNTIDDLSLATCNELETVLNNRIAGLKAAKTASV